MSSIPSIFGGPQIDVFDPFSLNLWDLSEGLLAQSSSFAREISQFASVRVDWKETLEAHVFKADLPGMKKEEVKVEDHRWKMGEFSRSAVSRARSRRRRTRSGTALRSQWQVYAKVQAPGECEDGGGEGYNGEWSSHCHSGRTLLYT